ncbi:hypothetical protein TL16_g03625 [Triparma laevis f. inornata]|uniref:Uncharacterized protein n=1 Tax=Triparma laevis f. inornata TaxID=1714386 RepID=A0A9W7A2X6_9STRA|nr:hypothetical protein TL16_g03625 [Triparma laevis f. inornata]
MPLFDKQLGQFLSSPWSNPDSNQIQLHELPNNLFLYPQITINFVLTHPKIPVIADADPRCPENLPKTGKLAHSALIINLLPSDTGDIDIMNQYLDSSRSNKVFSGMIVCQFVQDLASLRSLAESCVYFNVIINSKPADKLVFKILYLRSVNNMDPDWNSLVELEQSGVSPSSLSFRSKCIMMWSYRKNLIAASSNPPPQPSKIIELPHSRIYAPGPGPLLGIGYYGCKILGGSSLAVWGDFNGIKLVSEILGANDVRYGPPSQTALPNPNPNFITSIGENHGQVLSCLSHPSSSNPALFLSMSSGHVLCVPDPLKKTTLGEGTFVVYNYNAVCHGESEVNCLAVGEDGGGRGVLISSSFDGTVCVWPNALTETKMDKFQVVSRRLAHNTGIVTSLPLSSNNTMIDLFVLGDNRGRLELWKKILNVEGVTPPLSPEGELDDDDDSENTEGEGGVVDLTHLYERIHLVESCKTITSMKPEDQGSVTCLTALSNPGDYFACANNYGEIRGWRVTDSKLNLAFLINDAHACAIDNCVLIGNLLLTTGMAGVIKVWDVPGEKAADVPGEVRGRNEYPRGAKRRCIRDISARRSTPRFRYLHH